MQAMVDLPDALRPVIQTVTPFWPRSCSRSARVTEPSCQVMLVAFCSAMSRKLLSIGELEGVAFGIFSVTELGRIGRRGGFSDFYAAIDEFLSRFGDVGGVEANLGSPGVGDALVQGEAASAAGVEVHEALFAPEDRETELLLVEVGHVLEVVDEEDDAAEGEGHDRYSSSNSGVLR